MEFNIPKCNILQFTIHHSKSTFTYKMSNIPSEHAYLGIRLHHTLSWEPHGPCTFGPFQCIIIKTEKNKRLARTSRQALILFRFGFCTLELELVNSNCRNAV